MVERLCKTNSFAGGEIMDFLLLILIVLIVLDVLILLYAIDSINRLKQQIENILKRIEKL
jgi:hypothetical protein